MLAGGQTREGAYEAYAPPAQDFFCPSRNFFSARLHGDLTELFSGRHSTAVEARLARGASDAEQCEEATARSSRDAQKCPENLVFLIAEKLVQELFRLTLPAFRRTCRIVFRLAEDLVDDFVAILPFEFLTQFFDRFDGFARI